jgi:hypothetical protein
MGVSLRTSEDIFLDQDLIRGSKFEIFVPSRSRVEFYRNERLLSVQVLDFGLQEVDTRSFPQGSYDVQVVMTEDDGNVIRETRFFTKTGYLGVRSRPIFFGQVGLARDELDALDIPVYQVGTRWRATDILQLEASVQGTEDLAVGEVGILGFYRDILFGAGFSSSTENDIGYLANVSGQVLGLGFSASYSGAPGDSERELKENLDPEEERLQKLVNQAAFKRRGMSGSLYKTFGPLRFRYAGNLNEREAQTEEEEESYRWAHGPSIEWKIMEEGPVSIRWNAEFLQTNDGDQYSTDLNFRYKFSPDFSITTRANYRGDEDSDTLIGNFLTDYNTKDRTLRGTRLQLRMQGRQEERDVVSGGEGEDQEKTTKTDRELRTELHVEHTNLYLDSETFLVANRFGESDTNNIGGFVESNFIVTGGGVSVSNPVQTESLLLASIESETTESEFDVVVNDVVMDTVKAGETVAIGVTPYKTYTIRVRPKQNSDLVSYDPSIEKVVFFPGNVVRRVWNVERIFIGLGRLVNEEGEPIPLVRIKGTKEYAFSEKDGTFQIEISGTEGLRVETNKRNCTLDLPEVTSPEYFVDFGDVVCVPNVEQ